MGGGPTDLASLTGGTPPYGGREAPSRVRPNYDSPRKPSFTNSESIRSDYAKIPPPLPYIWDPPPTGGGGPN